MISSEEFQQKLQAGQIQAALALVGCDASLLQGVFTQQLDITTRITVDAQSPSNEYLRTKINLLTGAIENEFGGSVAIDENRYLQLKQLHIDQILSSYQIVSSHLDRLSAILTALLPTSIAPSISNQTVTSEWLNSDTLTVQLNRSLSPLISEPPHPDADIDLSGDEDWEIWEELVEDPDVISPTTIDCPIPPLPELNFPEWQDRWVRRPLNPIDIKPIIPRSSSPSVDPSEQWDRFAPEHLSLEANSQLPLSRNHNSRLHRLLANLDRTPPQHPETSGDVETST
jgi:hypothetical protein